jgi:hypothetical protein
VFVAEHLIEFWEIKGDRGSQWTLTCLTCNWFGGDGTRGEAEDEARLHLEGKRRPWQGEGSMEPRTPEKHPIPPGRISG